MADADLQTLPLNPLEIFAMQYFPRLLATTVPPAHRQIYSALFNRDIKRLAIEGFRGLAKSTLASRIYPLFLICETDIPEVQLISESGGATGLSTKWMKAMKKELETNQLLIADYGFKRGDAWGQDHIQVIRADGSIVDFYSRGKGASIRGSRGEIIIDDPQSIRDMQSEAIQQSDDMWFFDDVLPVLLKDQRIVFIGTRMSPLSLMSKVVKLQGWTFLQFPAEEPVGSGHSVWPDQFPDSYLAQQKSDMGSDIYGAEYLLQTRVPGNPVFREEWFQFYNPDSDRYRQFLQRKPYVVTGYDGAESKNDLADYTGIVTLRASEGEKPEIYVDDVRHNHWTMVEGISQLVLVKESMHQDRTVAESRVKEGNQGPIEEQIQIAEKTHHCSLNAVIVRPEVDKVLRANRVQGMVQNGQVFINPNNKEHRELMNELIMLGADGEYHDDLADAFVHALTDIKERVRRVANAPRRHPQAAVYGN